MKIFGILNENPMYTICPLDEVIDQKRILYSIFSASPFSYEHAKDRLNVLRANVLKYKIPIFLCELHWRIYSNRHFV